jgi:hypothetical protein
MDNISPEVLIYLQSVKNYFKTNNEAYDYFIGNSNEDLFFEHLIQISQKNFETEGEVMLNKEQFELLRKTIAAISIVVVDEPDESTKEVDIEKNIFVDYPNFGKICLN